MSFPIYPSHKDSSVEWLGAIPTSWDVQPVYAFSTCNDEVLEENTPSDFPIYYVEISDVDPIAGVGPGTELLFAAAPSRARRRVRPGDVLISTVRTYLRAIAPVRSPLPSTIASTGFAVMRPRKIDPGYLGYLFQSEYMVSEIIARSVGVSYPATNAHEITRLKAPVPPPHEQILISDFLDREIGKIDALVAEQERLMALLKEKRQAVISQAVTKGLDPNATMKPSGVEWLGDVPAHWTVRKLGAYSKLRGGSAFSSGDFGVDGIRVVRMNNLRRGHMDLSDAVCIPASSCIDSAALADGDLIWGMSGSLGESGSLGNYARVTKRDLPCQLNQRVGRFLCNEKDLSVDFLEYIIQTKYFYDQILLWVTGTAQSNISSEQVQACLVAAPPLCEQNRVLGFVRERLSELDHLVVASKQAVFLLKERRAALISAAVTGKIDVRGLVSEAQAA